MVKGIIKGVVAMRKCGSKRGSLCTTCTALGAPAHGAQVVYDSELLVTLLPPPRECTASSHQTFPQGIRRVPEAPL